MHLIFSLAWLHSAQASETYDHLSESLAVAPRPTFSVACGPIGPMEAAFRESPILRTYGAIFTAQVLASRSAGATFQQLREAGTSGMGIASEGVTVIEGWRGPEGLQALRIQLPMEMGTEAEAPDRVQQLETITGREVQASEPDRWSLAGGDWSAHFDDSPTSSTLILGRGVPSLAPAEGAGVLPQDAPADGCHGYLQLPPGAGLRGGEFFFAMTDDPTQPISVRFESPVLALPDAFAAGSTPAAPATSSGPPPEVVLTLGVSPLDLLEALKPKDRMQAAGVVHELEELRRFIEPSPGATLAVWGLGQEPVFVLVAPVTHPDGRAIRKRTFRRMMRKGVGADSSLELLPDGFFRFTMRRQTITGHFDGERVVLGTATEQLTDVIDGAGRPWLTEADEEWSQSWPVSLVYTLSSPKSPELSSLSGRMGVKGQNNRVEVALQTRTPMGLASPGLFALAAGVGIPNFIAGQHRSKRREVPQTIEEIAAAVRESGSGFDDVMSLPVAPRTPEQLSKGGVPWDASDEWSVLGWSPEGSYRGIYWVERAEDGRVEIHGMADIDGDGVSCHYSKLEGEPVKQLTPDQVY